MGPARRAALHGPLAAASLALIVFLPALGFPFLNWDDHDVFVRNDALHAPGVVAWAFTTRYMEHYQPLAWLTWAAIDRSLGQTPAAAHALNIGLHGLCAALLFLLARGVVAEGMGQGREASGGGRVCLAAALIWAIHPLRVEPVAWASAMPYMLASAFALAATLAWATGRAAMSAVLFAASLLARPVGLLLPAVLWLLRRPASARERAIVGMMAVAAVAAAIVESSARLTARLTEVGAGARLTLAATAPWQYLWRTVWPASLTPLDPLALNPRVEPLAIALGLGGIAIVSAAAWKWRRDHPVPAAAWVAYLLLLVPAMGLVPSGLQATADRYSYLPALPLSVALAWVFARARGRGWAVVAAAVIAVLATLTWQQTQYWRDSIALWTRAVAIDGRNDVALYNLGSALGDAGRRGEAVARYEQVLALVPGNEAARRNRDLLEAQRLEDEANALAARRDLDAAIALYSQALALDARRTHSQAALGIALTERGRYIEARPHLQAATELGATDPAVPNALAYVLVESGDPDAAIAVLRDAQRRHPGDQNIARNLQRLLGGSRR